MRLANYQLASPKLYDVRFVKSQDIEMTNFRESVSHGSMYLTAIMLIRGPCIRLRYVPQACVFPVIAQEAVSQPTSKSAETSSPLILRTHETYGKWFIEYRLASI